MLPNKPESEPDRPSDNVCNSCEESDSSILPGGIAWQSWAPAYKQSAEVRRRTHTGAAHIQREQDVVCYQQVLLNGGDGMSKPISGRDHGDTHDADLDRLLRQRAKVLVGTAMAIVVALLLVALL